MEDFSEVEDESLQNSERYSPLGEQAATEPAASIGAELREDAARRLQLAILRLERFLRREECARLDWDPTRRLGKTFIDEGRRLLRGALSDSAAPPCEPTLRST